MGYTLVKTYDIHKDDVYLHKGKRIRILQIYYGSPPLVKFSTLDGQVLILPLKSLARRLLPLNAEFENLSNVKVGGFYTNKLGKERQVLSIKADGYDVMIHYVTVNEPDNYKGHCFLHSFQKWLTRQHN